MNDVVRSVRTKLTFLRVMFVLYVIGTVFSISQIIVALDQYQKINKLIKELGLDDLEISTALHTSLSLIIISIITTIIQITFLVYLNKYLREAKLKLNSIISGEKLAREVNYEKLATKPKKLIITLLVVEILSLLLTIIVRNNFLEDSTGTSSSFFGVIISLALDLFMYTSLTTTSQTLNATSDEQFEYNEYNQSVQSDQLKNSGDEDIDKDTERNE